MLSSRSIRFTSIFASLIVVFSMVAVDQADARRGGSFGSRGSRTFQQAPVTRTAPTQVSPIERSVSPRTNSQTTTAAPQTRQQPGIFGAGFGGSIMRGLFFGGLLGLFLGYGFGGIAGVFGLLMQVLLIGGGLWLLMRLLRSRSQPAIAGGPNTSNYQGLGATYGQGGGSGGLHRRSTGASAARPQAGDAISITDADRDSFERMLGEVQDAYSREDYETLRRLSTPEMSSYLAQELGENASRGLRNEVSDLKLLQGDVAEAWREGNAEFATVAMRYSSLDVTRDRASGEVVEGDADAATENTELWTFVRSNRGPWTLSAIQQA